MSQKLKAFLYEFWIFGLKQARACVFAGSFLGLLFLSNHIPLGPLARYDFLFLAAIAIQIVLIWSGLETKKEAKIILLFHIIGFILEAYKTHPAIGSWSYPEEGFFKILNVPLYSGFMYAAVGSYMSQSWKVLKLRLTNYPSYWFSIPTAAAIYLNFFTHHHPLIPDIRWWLIALVLIVFANSRVYFTVLKKERWMPVSLSFLLIGFFIWVAENFASYWGAWKYPDQMQEWTFVSMGKISSWSLLVIISFIIVADLMHRRRTKGS